MSPDDLKLTGKWKKKKPKNYKKPNTKPKQQQQKKYKIDERIDSDDSEMLQAPAEAKLYLTYT